MKAIKFLAALAALTCTTEPCPPPPLQLSPLCIITARYNGLIIATSHIDCDDVPRELFAVAVSLDGAYAPISRRPRLCGRDELWEFPLRIGDPGPWDVEVFAQAEDGSFIGCETQVRR